MNNYIVILNFVIINIIIWVVLSYFWSFWTYKLFKPYLWLEEVKKKLIHNKIVKIERKAKDKNRFYSFWYLLRMTDENMVEGSMLMAGIENIELPVLVSSFCTNRQLTIIDEFETKNYHTETQTCDGVIKKDDVNIAHVELDRLKNALTMPNINIIKGSIVEKIKSIDGKIAFAAIDSVKYEDVLQSLAKVYELLSPNGIIVVHDYNHNWLEVKKAVDVFQASVPENFIALPDMYGSVAMVKNSAKISD